MNNRFTIERLQQLLAAGKIRSYQVKHKSVPDDQPAGGSKKAKYRNRKKEVDGIVFDSEKEARRYGDLMLQLKAGEIGLLELQKEFVLKVDGKKICKYKADFVYVIMATGESVVEDVKSDATRKLPAYRLKKKLMRAIYGIEISEV
jgi:hypothetical protein